jgi:hypothetical protein
MTDMVCLRGSVSSLLQQRGVQRTAGGSAGGCEIICIHSMTWTDRASSMSLVSTCLSTGSAGSSCATDATCVYRLGAADTAKTIGAYTIGAYTIGAYTIGALSFFVLGARRLTLFTVSLALALATEALAPLFSTASRLD